MKNIAIAVLVFLVINSFVSAQTGECDTSSWTITSQQPVSCRPYSTQGIFHKELPNAGRGGPIDHLYPNSDAIASHTLTSFVGSNQWAGIGFATPGFDDHIGVPLYYGTSNDPIYKIAACSATCGTPGTENYALNTYWHIPNQARYSGTHLAPWSGGGDNFLLVWDQTNNKVLRLYGYELVRTSGSGILPSCAARTQADACPISARSAQVTNHTTSTGYQVSTGGGDSLHNGGAALVLRHRELIEGDIRHALYLNSPCVNSKASPVFPAVEVGGGYGCDQRDYNDGKPVDAQDSLRPVEGNLFFLDYTDAQIDAMNIPTWQKTMVRAMAHYGMYHGDTTGGRYDGMFVGRVESGEAYELNGGSPSPIYSWLQGQGWSCTGTSDPSGSKCRYAKHFLSGLPALTGPNCPTVACGVDRHIHIAAECVAKGMAGLPGGCSGPQSPTNLRITSTTP